MPFFRNWMLEKFGTSNSNCVLYVVYFLSIQFSNGLLLSGQIALYLMLITNSQAKVGYAEAVFGAFAVLPGLLGGYFADKGRRDTVMRWGGFVTGLGVLALAALCSVYLASHRLDRDLNEVVRDFGSYQFLLCSVCVAIIYGGESLGDAASQALVADSIATGERLKFNSSISFYGNAFYGTGPIVTAIVSAIQHNKWTEHDFTVIILIGVCVRIPCIILFFFFDDNNVIKSGVADAVQEADSEVEASLANESFAPEGATWQERLRRRVSLVPQLYFLSDILWCFGSGMTVKFFPVFFKDPMMLTPVVVFIIQAAQPYIGMPFFRVAEWMADRIGRVQADLLMWYLAIVCQGMMAVMGYIHDYNTHIANRIVLIALFLLRCGIIRSTGPIQQSIVMDYVKKEHRAKWASLDSFTQAGWSGSAAVGGYLIQHYSYQLCFLVACGFHLSSCAVRWPLMWVVPKTVVKVASYDSHRTAALLSVRSAAGRVLGSGEEATAVEEADLRSIFDFMGTSAHKSRAANDSAEDATEKTKLIVSSDGDAIN